MRSKYNSVSEVDRRRIVEAYLSGQNALTIAKVVGVKRTTVNTIITKFVEEGRIEAKKRGGRKAHKLSDEQKLTVRKWMDEDKSISLAKLKQRCSDNFGVTVSEATISRLLNRSSNTVGQAPLPLLPERQQDALSIESTLQYAQTFLQLLEHVQRLNQAAVVNS